MDLSREVIMKLPVEPGSTGSLMFTGAASPQRCLRMVA